MMNNYNQHVLGQQVGGSEQLQSGIDQLQQSQGAPPPYSGHDPPQHGPVAPPPHGSTDQSGPPEGHPPGFNQSGDDTMSSSAPEGHIGREGDKERHVGYNTVEPMDHSGNIPPPVYSNVSSPGSPPATEKAGGLETKSTSPPRKNQAGKPRAESRRHHEGRQSNHHRGVEDPGKDMDDIQFQCAVLKANHDSQESKG